MRCIASIRYIFVAFRNPHISVSKLNAIPQQILARTSCIQGVQRCFSTSKLKRFPKEAHESSLRYIYVNTSVDFWEECPHGVTFDVGYVDSHSPSETSQPVPVIVGLPGILGTHEELSDLLLPFGKLGYRVLIPNAPGNKYTKGVSQADEDFFTFSIEERSAFVKDFLGELDIDKVHMLVTSHCSVYPGLFLTLREPEKYRSLVIINPSGVRPSRIMKPVKRHKLFAKLWDSPILRVFLKGAIFLVKPFTSFRGWDLRKVITFSRSVAGTSYEEVKDILDSIDKYKKPRFVIYCDKDQLVETEIMEEMVERLISKSNVKVIKDDKSASNQDSNQSANSTRTSAIDINNIKGVKFEGVKGDVLATKASVIKKLLWDYMKKVVQGS